MKRNKVYVLFTAILSLTMFCAALIAPILAKYTTVAPAPYGDDEYVDYTVSSVFEVRNQEELFAAINQGYPYIQLSKDIENPLIITQSAEDLSTDLILDLNGIEIQRNGPEPILNISKDVRLTVTDTSDEQTGGLYNPVGSVFNVNGGVLTVVTGVFESGPRYSEYYSYNTEVLQDGGDTKRTRIERVEDVEFYQGETKSTKKMPIIRSYPVETGEIIYNHGNLYFDETVSTYNGTGFAKEILADTYCYYRTSEDKAADANPSNQADWYYTYYVKKTGNIPNANIGDYVGPTLSAGDNAEDYVKITIYGYESAIAKAASTDKNGDNVEDDVGSYYAAIQMQEGTLSVQKGGFFSYFGVDKTACVNAVSGTINVREGKFSSRIPNAESEGSNSVTTKGDDSAAFGKAYFDIFNWANVADTDGARARAGESFCILNGGDATVKIGTGEFYSSNNNLIGMQGGSLEIGGGTFTKKLLKNAKTPTARCNAAAAIYMTSGTLFIKNADISTYGDYAQAVYIQNGKLDIADSECRMEGSKTYGIYSTVGGQNFTVTDTSFTLTGGEQQVGIHVAEGQVLLSASGEETISLSGTSSVGIYAAEGGTVTSNNYRYNLEGDNSSGVYSLEGSVTLTGGSITLKSNISCYGVYAVSQKENTACNVTLNGTEIDVGYDSTNVKSAGDTAVASSVGVYLSSNDTASAVSLNKAKISCYEVGVALNGGSLTVTGGGEIKTNRASAIVVSGGNLTFEGNTDATAEEYVYNVTSANTTSESTENTYQITLPFNTSYTDSNIYDNYDGVYVSGGEFECNGQLTLTHTGLRNVTDYTYYNQAEVTSYAVRVVGGDVNILQGSITAEIGGGICATVLKDQNGNITDIGSITMGIKENTQAYNIEVNTNGKVTGNGYDPTGVSSAGNWNVEKSITGGHAIELNGGNITIYYGSYIAQLGNGVLAKGLVGASEAANATVGYGTIKIYDGVFNGWMAGVNTKSGPGAFYGLKVIGGSYVYVYGGEFDGGNGGAFVMGVDTFSSSNSFRGAQAKVYIYEGIFGNQEKASRDAFNIFDNSYVVFGAHPQDNDKLTIADRKNAIKMYAASNGACISVNTLGFGGAGSAAIQSTVRIYYGTYTTGYSIYNEDNACTNIGRAGVITVYNKDTYTSINEATTGTSNFEQYSNVSGGPYYYPDP